MDKQRQLKPYFPSPQYSTVLVKNVTIKNFLKIKAKWVRSKLTCFKDSHSSPPSSCEVICLSVMTRKIVKLFFFKVFCGTLPIYDQYQDDLLLMLEITGLLFFG
jgi:hypothetical protein